MLRCMAKLRDGAAGAWGQMEVRLTLIGVVRYTVTLTQSSGSAEEYATAVRLALTATARTATMPY